MDTADGSNLNGSGAFYNTLLTPDQRQQQQQFYLAAAAAAAASCYPLDLQLYTAPPRLAPDPYWSARHPPLAWYSRSHPTPPPSTVREEPQQQVSGVGLQECCYYSDLAAALHNFHLTSASGAGGNGSASGVSSERGTYSPIQYANWAAYQHATASPSTQASSSPFPALYGSLGGGQQQQNQYHSRHGQQQHHQHHHGAAPNPMAMAAAAAAAVAASRMHQTDFDPGELARLCPG